MKKYIFLLWVICQCGLARSVDLSDVYQDALQHDPVYLEAIATWHAAEQKIPVAQAALLPTLGADLRTAGLRFGFGSTEGVAHVNNHSAELKLKQPLFDLAAWQAVHIAKDEVKQAAAQYHLAGQVLIQRVVKAYLAVLLAEDLLAVQESQLKATARQLDEANQKLAVGVVTETSVHQAKAGYDKVVANVIEAKNNIRLAREELRRMTGRYYDRLQPLQSDIIYPQPDPKHVDAWSQSAKQHNLNVIMARFAMDAGRHAVLQAKAGHLPTLMADMSYADQTNNLGHERIDMETRSVGVSLHMPLLQGGGVRARVRQATYQRQALQQALKKSMRLAEYDARFNFHSVKAQISKIGADRQAIISNKSSVNSTEQAYRSGTQTIIDVLNTQRDLFGAQANYAEDQYAYINSWLALKLAVGELSQQDLLVINRWLVHKQADVATA